MPPACDRNPSRCHISTFVALSPQYFINVQAGTPLGEAKEEMWDEVLLQQGEVLVLVSTARHHGLPPPPPPPGKRCKGHCSRTAPPIGVIRGSSRIRRISTPPLPLELKDCLGPPDGEGGEGVPTFGQQLLLVVG